MMNNPSTNVSKGAPSGHRTSARISVIIPALNEEQALPSVLRSIPWAHVDEVLVVDNGSTDRTIEVGVQGGARVVVEPHRGYGSACLRGIAELRRADLVVFLDADGSDRAEDIPKLVAPILQGRADFVLASRTLGRTERGALTLPQRFGNRLAVWLIALLFRKRYTDLAPFRALRRESLECLGMTDRGCGWTVEMQVKAVWQGLRIEEIPAAYRRRIAGRSKISGTISGTIRAGWRIIGTIVQLAVTRR